jgi:RHH-type transcriptional regulator, rel operon repressor / antitoxin RelB
MITLCLPVAIDRRLTALAKKTGRTKTFYAEQAIRRLLEDYEDDHLARRRLAFKGGRVTLDQLERKLGR